MSEIKLLYCIPALSNPGGMERILTDKINFLVKQGNIEVFIVTTDQKGEKSFFELDSKVNFINLDLDFISLFSLSMIRKYFCTKKKLKLYAELLKEIIEKNNIDICISTGGKELEFLYQLNVDCKKVLEIHFAKNFRKQFLLARKNNLLFQLLGYYRTQQLVKQTITLDAVVVLTKNDQKEWQKTHDNIHQIYNFSSIITDKVANVEGNRAIAIGRLDAQKGFDMLIDAWFLKKDQLKEWTLDIFGKGEWEEMLQDKISNYGLQNRIFLKGVSNDVERELELSSLFLFSSRYEGFGLVLIEAMSLGLPIISFDCPHGPSELITDNGLLIPKENITKFSDAIYKLTQNKTIRKQMGIISKQKAQSFSKKHIMTQWTTLFNDLKV